MGRNLVLKGELLQIVRCLSEAGVACVVLKGVPLTLELYGNLSLRGMRDNDVLVRRAHVRRACQALQELGFESEPVPTLESSLAATFQHSLWREHPGGLRSECEIHWRPFPPSLFELSEDRVFENTRVQSVDGHELRVLGKELSLIHLAGHFVQHMLGEPRIVEDVGRAWQHWHATLDEARLQRLAHQLQARHVLDFVLRAAHRAGYCEIPLPDWLHSARASFVLELLPIERLLQPTQEYHYGRALLSWSLLPAPRIMQNALHEVLPSPARMRYIHPHDGRARLLLRYLERPLRPLAASVGLGSKQES